MAGFKKNKRGEKKAKPVRETFQHKPWDQDMVMASSGEPSKKVEYGTLSYFSESLYWVSLLNPAECRYPEEKTTRYQPSVREKKKNKEKEVLFTAAGKDYYSIEDLWAKEEEISCEQVAEVEIRDKYSSRWYQDCYGRDVFNLVVAESICLDEFDIGDIHELRCWYFIREDRKLTRIYFDNHSDYIYVTEDVRYLEYDIWAFMKRKGYFR